VRLVGRRSGTKPRPGRASLRSPARVRDVSCPCSPASGACSISTLERPHLRGQHWPETGHVRPLVRARRGITRPGSPKPFEVSGPRRAASRSVSARRPWPAARQRFGTPWQCPARSASPTVSRTRWPSPRRSDRCRTHPGRARTLLDGLARCCGGLVATGDRGCPARALDHKTLSGHSLQASACTAHTSDRSFGSATPFRFCSRAAAALATIRRPGPIRGSLAGSAAFHLWLVLSINGRCSRSR